MRQSSFKKGLGTSEDATKRHVDMKRNTTKEQRQEKIQKKRNAGSAAAATTPIVSIPEAIQSLSFNVDCLPQLHQILRLDAADRYFSQSPLYPEITGPYLFTTDKPFYWLMSLLKHPSIEIVKLVTSCFCNISAHEEDGIYVPRLIKLGLVERLLEILNIDPPTILATLSNMCRDNVESRDYIVSSAIIGRISSIGEQHLFHIVDLFCAIFKYRDYLPNAQLVKPLFQIMTHDVLFGHFPETPSDRADRQILNRILIAVFKVVAASDDYKAELVDDGPLMNQLCRYNTIEAAKILSELTQDRFLHPKLTSLIPKFTYFLNMPDADLKIEGALGLANLAESEASFPLIVSDPVMHSIRMQFENVEISPVLHTLYYTLAWMAISGAQEQMIPFICRLSDALILPESTLVQRTIVGIGQLLKWDKDRVLPVLEECEGMTRLNRLINHRNENIQELVIQLMEWIDNGTEFMED